MPKLIVALEHAEAFFLERAKETLAGLGLQVNTAKWTRWKNYGHASGPWPMWCEITLENPLTRSYMRFRYDYTMRANGKAI